MTTDGAVQLLAAILTGPSAFRSSFEWSFASHILRGGYTHRIVRDDQFSEDTDPESLRPIHRSLPRPPRRHR